MSPSDCDTLKCGASAASWPATCSQCRAACSSRSNKCVNYKSECTTAPRLPSIGDKSNRVGDAINLKLPAATSGTGTIAYSLSGYPSGLTFTASSRTLSGTIGGISGSMKTYPYVTYRATNSAGSDTETFDWTVTRSVPTPPPTNECSDNTKATKKVLADGITKAACLAIRNSTTLGAEKIGWQCYDGTGIGLSNYPVERSSCVGREKRSVIECDDANDTLASSTAECDYIEGLPVGFCYQRTGSPSAPGYDIVGKSVREDMCNHLWAVTLPPLPETKKCIDDRRAGEVVHGTITRAACVAIANTTLWGIERIGWECYSGSGSRYNFRRTSCDPGHEKENVIWCEDSQTSMAHSTAECTYIEHKEKPECVYEGDVLARAGVWTPAECDETKAEKDAAKDGMMRCELPVGLHFALTALIGDDSLPIKFTMASGQCAKIRADYLLVLLQSKDERDAFIRQAAGILGLL